MRNTEDNRKLLAELIERPFEDVKHYAVIVDTGDGLAVNFCGIARNGMRLMAGGIMFLIVEGDAVDASKWAGGSGTACDW